jgi:hypothetical protein
MLNHSTYPVLFSLVKIHYGLWPAVLFLILSLCDIFAEDQVRSIFTVWSEHMSVLNEWVFTTYSSHFSEDNRKVLATPVHTLRSTDQLGRLTEYTECQAFCSIVGIGSPPHPLQPQASVALPFWVWGGRHTRWGGGGGRTQFRRETDSLVLYV